MNTKPTGEIIYHMDPQGVILRYPDLKGTVMQAIIYCQTCEKWKDLSYDNSLTLPQGGDFNYQTQKYVGYCLTDECKKEQEERFKQRQKDERFWNAVRAQQKVCDDADRRCDEFFKNAMREQEKRNKDKDENKK